MCQRQVHFADSIGEEVTLSPRITNNIPLPAGTVFSWTVKQGNTTIATSNAADFAFTPPTQGTYNIALTKTDASGTSTVATSVADVDTPAGWTMAYDAYFPGGELDNTIFHGIGTAYNGVTANMGEGITGSVGALLSMPLHGNKTLTMKVDNLPKHGWINAGAAAMFFNIYAPGSQYTVRVDGELVAQVSMHDYLDVFYKTWIPHTSSSVTITLEVTGLNSTDEWWNGGIGVSTFLPTVSLSGGGNVDEGGSTTITATRDNPYDASTWASMSTEEQAEALPALTVPLDWSGSAGESDIGNRPTEIKILAGQAQRTISITAADDNTAEWGESAIVAPKNSDQPYIAAVNNNLAINIFDHDFKITLDADSLTINNDDSDEDGVNDLEDIDGVTNDSRLYELTIKAPTDFVSGASLTINAPSQVKLYTDASKQHPVVGGSWVLGAMAGSLPTNLFVEAIGVGVAIGDIIISGLLDNPATTLETNSPTTRPAATQSSTTQPALVNKKMKLKDYVDDFLKAHPEFKDNQVLWTRSMATLGCIGLTTINLGTKPDFTNCFKTYDQAKKFLDDMVKNGQVPQGKEVKMYSIHFHNSKSTGKDGVHDAATITDPITGRVDISNWDQSGKNAPGVNFDYGVLLADGTVLHADLYDNPDNDNDGIGDVDANLPIHNAEAIVSSMKEWQKSYIDFNFEVWCVQVTGNNLPAGVEPANLP